MAAGSDWQDGGRRLEPDASAAAGRALYVTLQAISGLKVLWAPVLPFTSQALLEKASALLGRPVSMIAGRAHLRDALPDALKPLFFAFEPIMKPDWLVDSE